MPFTVWSWHYDMPLDVFDLVRDGEDYEIRTHGIYDDYEVALARAQDIHQATGHLVQIECGSGLIWDSADGVYLFRLD